MRASPIPVRGARARKRFYTALAIVVEAYVVNCGGQSVETSTTDEVGGSGGEAACPRTEAEAPTDSVTIVLQNERSEPVYVPLQECSEFFRVSAVDASTEGTFPRPYVFGGDPLGRGVVIPRCELEPSGCPGTQQNGCGSLPVLELGAGEMLSFEWSGAVYPIVAVPPHCVDPRSPCREQGGECVAEQAASPGRYRVEIPAVVRLPAWQCAPTQDCACERLSDAVCCEGENVCPCQEYADGTCRHLIHETLETDLPVEYEFEYPARGPVVVVVR